jgi:hypothetical protein
MKIVHIEDVPLVAVPTTRAGTLDRRTLLAGDPDSPGNFVCGVYYQSGDFYAPRHRHNFDQWRYQLEGETNLNATGVLRPGTLGYFPEGAHYGPNGREGETTDVRNVIVLVQFGGPGGNGFVSSAKFAAAREELKALGTFDGGVFHRNAGVAGKTTLDSFQATWEHAQRRSMVYPASQYNAAILMNTHAYRWMPLAGAPGVEAKLYGTFSDCAIRAAGYKLDPGATFAASGRGIFIVLGGNGTLADGPYRPFTGLYLDSGERAAFTASETTEILLMGLPDIARMKTGSASAPVARRFGGA